MGDNCEVCVCKAYIERLRAVRKLLKEHGCDCPCDHHPDERSDNCEVCLACLIGEVVGNDTNSSIETGKLAQPSIEADGWVTIYDTLL